MPPVKKYNHNEELEVSNKRLKETAEIIADRLEDEKDKTKKLKKDNKSLKHHIKELNKFNSSLEKERDEILDHYTKNYDRVLNYEIEVEELNEALNTEREKSRRMEETLRNKLFDRTLKIQGLQKESKLLKKKLKLQSNNNHRMFNITEELWKLIETMRREK